MNIRKNIDYTEMYEALDELMSQQLSQMKLYWEIGKAVCRRTEKGAAVMASEYLNKQYPDVKGFSPRSLRRIRDFYRTYENYPALLSRAMKLGWTQNVVIMEADLTMELRDWYVRAALQFGWSKAELMAQIVAEAHLEIVLDIEDEVCDNSHNEEEPACYFILLVSMLLGNLCNLCCCNEAGSDRRGEGYHGALCGRRRSRRSGSPLGDITIKALACIQVENMVKYFR